VQHASAPVLGDESKSHGLEEKDGVLASSTVKLLAKQNKINLHELKGTGRRGRVLKDDIIHFL
jgi:pyruvate/2-oxoglutarate dehydrogenase complex dihydrolipoamide acyltransferase (E2) component